MKFTFFPHNIYNLFNNELKRQNTLEKSQLSFPIKSFIPFTELKEVEKFLTRFALIEEWYEL